MEPCRPPRSSSALSTHLQLPFHATTSPAPSKLPQALIAIVFRNHYCSHVTIKQRRESATNSNDYLDEESEDNGVVEGRGGKGEDPWETILLNRQLMEDPHYEGDAQNWHVINVDEFDKDNYRPNSNAPLRIYMYQASPMWTTVRLEHVKCVAFASPVSMPALLHPQTSLPGLQDREGVVAHVDETIEKGAEMGVIKAAGGSMAVCMPHKLGEEERLERLCRVISEEIR
ncbi:unnamed protein product, partial [Discosporangium mesarthrocarpum]